MEVFKVDNWVNLCISLDVAQQNLRYLDKEINVAKEYPAELFVKRKKLIETIDSLEYKIKTIRMRYIKKEDTK